MAQLSDHVAMMEGYVAKHPDDAQAQRVLFRLRSCQPGEDRGPVKQALLRAVNDWDAAKRNILQ